MSQHKPTREADPYFRELDLEAPTPRPLAASEHPDAAGQAPDGLEDDDLASYSLRPRSNPFLRPALWLGGLGFLGVLGWQTWQGLASLYATHWSLAALAGGALLAAGGLGVAALWRFIAGGRDLRRVEAVRGRAELLMRESGFGHARPWAGELRELYAGKPQERLLVSQLAALPDYENDAEVLQRLSDGFLGPLDRQAHKVIWRFSRETGVMVGLSPLALLDVGLALWRSLRMIDRIAQIYGIRPSLIGRVRLLRLVAQQLAFVGVTEMTTDAVSQVASGALFAGLSLRLGQGLGAGLYTARIGLAAMEICRPLPTPVDRQRLINRLVTSLRKSLQSPG